MKLTRSRQASIAVIGACIVLALVLSGCGKEAVPNVVGKSQADAVRALEDAGFTLGTVSSVYSNQVPVGAIAASTPPAGTKAKKGSEVGLSINSGIQGAVKVPMVTGVPQATAEDTLKQIELVPFVATAYSTTVTAGVVIAQVPSYGTYVAAGDQVVLQVSKGPAPKTVAVPNVTGKTQADATTAIENADLKAKVYSVYSSTVAKGKVIGQSPAASAKVTVGTEVGIAVSLGKGVGAVTVPNVSGKSETDAVNAMKSAGLVPTVYHEYSDTIAKGLVSGQLPGAGTTTAQGAEVAIVVSLGKTTGSGNITVPAVTGKPQADATATLQEAGFAVEVIPEASTTTSGTVTGQLPVSGSTAPPDSTVVIVVSSGPGQ